MSRKRVPLMKFALREIADLGASKGMIGIKVLYLITGDGLWSNVNDIPFYFHEMLIKAKRVKKSNIVEVTLYAR